MGSLIHVNTQARILEPVRQPDDSVTKSIDSLPLDIDGMFNEIEQRTPVRLNAEQRLMYYADFTCTALGSTTLHFRDVEALIARKKSRNHGKQNRVSGTHDK